MMSTPLRLTRAQSREIDRRSLEEFHIPTIVLMENAARGLADVAMKFLNGVSPSALILCGGGNNGGDGLALARHLHNRGVAVSIGLTIAPEKFKGDALINWAIVQAMGLATLNATPEAISRNTPDLIVDAIFGTGLQQAPRAPFGEIAAAIRQTERPVLAVDLPSGMDCDTGDVPGDCVVATTTLTFVAEKAGFANAAALPFTGEIVVGDIGCPKELFLSVGRG